MPTSRASTCTGRRSRHHRISGRGSIDVREMAADDRDDSLGSRVPGRDPDRAVCETSRVAGVGHSRGMPMTDDQMTKLPKSVFVCQECGAQSPKWLGRCADCGAWNSFVEERVSDSGGPQAARHRYSTARAPARRRLYADIEIEQHAPRVDRHWRVRSRPRRRRRARLARAARRRTWHRQVDAAAAGGGQHGADGRSRPVQLR